MYIFYQWLKVLEGILIASTIASALCLIPVIGWIACLIAAILGAAALAGVLAGLAHAMSDAASPSDVNPDLGSSLATNGCDGQGADLVMVSGEWVYDLLHDGWNEIHPIRQCQKIWNDGWNGTWPFDVNATYNAWCAAIGDASSPLTRSNQDKPENHWQIYPVIDGCDPDQGDDKNDGPIIR